MRRLALPENRSPPNVDIAAQKTAIEVEGCP